jgi:hypothetical protein
MKKPLTKSGTCKNCGINCYKEKANQPTVWPCGVEGCPYPRGEIIAFPQSATGSSLLQIAGN